jgi:hypothetical protein
MPRGVSTKLLTGLPESYSSDWLNAIDKRTKVWRAISSRIDALESDLGGSEDLSHAKRSLVRRVTFLELLCETQEMRFAAGEVTDVGVITQCFNSMLGDDAANATCGALTLAAKGPDLRTLWARLGMTTAEWVSETGG